MAEASRPAWRICYRRWRDCARGSPLMARFGSPAGDRRPDCGMWDWHALCYRRRRCGGRGESGLSMLSTVGRRRARGVCDDEAQLLSCPGRAADETVRRRAEEARSGRGARGPEGAASAGSQPRVLRRACDRRRARAAHCEADRTRGAEGWRRSMATARAALLRPPSRHRRRGAAIGPRRLRFLRGHGAPAGERARVRQVGHGGPRRGVSERISAGDALSGRQSGAGRLFVPEWRRTAVVRGTQVQGQPRHPLVRRVAWMRIQDRQQRNEAEYVLRRHRRSELHPHSRRTVRSSFRSAPSPETVSTTRRDSRQRRYHRPLAAVPRRARSWALPPLPVVSSAWSISLWASLQTTLSVAYR